MIKTIWGVTFYVSDLKKAKEFYEKTLGLTKKYEYSSYAGFECGSMEIGLIPKEKVEIGENAPTVEFVVGDIDRFCETLKRKNVDIVEPPHNEQWGGRQASFKDPDGNILEVVQINWEKYFNVAVKGSKKQ
jgi:catechol 2,3-dioxygenase-like lactoylglutathione lyase family enzyme